MKSLLKLPQDKLLHILAGLAIFMCLLPFIGPDWALALAGAVGVLKELYDMCRRDTHTSELWDAVATAAGGAAGFFCTFF